MKTITVSENVLNHIRHQIVVGAFSPGQKLNEVDLAATLGVSTAPVREALRVLQNEYLVKTIPRKGTFVTELSIEDCRQIYEVRKIIECACVDILQSRNTRELSNNSITELLPYQSLLDALSERKKTFSGLARFHFGFPRLVDNKWLTSLYDSIACAIIRYQLICYEPGYPQKFEDEHERFSTLIKNGHYDQAKEFLKKHIDHAFTVIADQMTRDLKRTEMKQTEE